MLRLLLPAGEIPLKSTVTVRTGEKRYLLTNELKIYDKQDNGNRSTAQVIKAKEGAVFLTPTDNVQGDINAVSSKTMLLWNVEEEVFEPWLYERINGPSQ